MTNINMYRSSVDVPNIKTQIMARMSLQERAIAIELLEAGASHEQVCGSIPIVRFWFFFRLRKKNLFTMRKNKKPRACPIFPIYI